MEFLQSNDMSEKHPLIGKVLGDDYEIISFLGRGGMGSVFIGQQQSLNRRVGVKVLPVLNLSTDELKRFEREIAAMATLSHPNIVTIHHRGKYGDPSTLYYVMEFLEGGSLKDYLQKFGKIPPVLAIRLLMPIVDALAYAHEQGCIHRDIKPDNLLFTSDYRSLKVADFGIAKLTEGLGITHSQAMVGTFLYAAPEQMKWFEEESGETTIDERADQYSLGIVLYEMISGQLPYQATNLMEMIRALSSNPRSLSDAAGYEVIPSLENLVAKMISKSREQRFADDESLLAAFGEVELELGTSVSSKVFHLKPQEKFKITNAPSTTNFPTDSEQIAIQSLETIDCIPQISLLSKYKQYLLYYLSGNWTKKFSGSQILTILLSFCFIVALLFIGFSGENNNSSNNNSSSGNTTDSMPLVSMRIDPIYNPQPPVDYPKLQVILISLQGLRPVQLQDKVYPGHYQLSVILPGYLCQQHGKTIHVRRAQLFHLSLTLNAVPRKVSPKIFNTNNGQQVLPLLFEIDKKPVLGNRFKPGEHFLHALFYNYQELESKLILPPGESTYQYQASLVALREIFFSLSLENKKIGTQDKLEAYVDNKKQIPAHFQYRIADGQLRTRIKVAPNAQNILLRSGFYYATAPIEKLYLLNKLERIDISLLLKHLAKIKSKNLLGRELASLWKNDREKLLQLDQKTLDKLYAFLVTRTTEYDYKNMNKPLWDLRCLLNQQEMKERKVFTTSYGKAQSISYVQRITLWKNFLTAYPQGIYRRKVLSLIAYNRHVARYERIFRESVRECHLSSSEKKMLRKWERKIRARDIAAVKNTVAEYLKRLGCRKSLVEMLK